MALIVGWVLPIILLVIGWVIVSYFLNKRKSINGKTDKEFSAIKYAFISAIVIVAIFLVYVFFIITCTTLPSTSGIWLAFLPLISIVLGIEAFLISWAVIIIFILFSQKHRSTIPKKKLVIHVILSIVILSFIFLRTYTSISTKLLFREIESPQTSQTRLSEIYAKAIKRGDTRILGKLAINPNISIQMLEEIYASYQQYPVNAKYYPIFVSLAKNKNTPVKILEELAKREVRCYVAGNPNTSVETLRILAKDPDFLVRTSVADNKNTPHDILVKLKSDWDPLVREHARSQLPDNLEQKQNNDKEK